MHTTPLISILLPAYNAGAFLDASLRSVQRQTEPRWECVVVDDGSEDGTLEHAQRFAARDPRFLILQRSHRGVIGALNHGLEYCRGRYVARMDADDVMHRERLRLQLALLENQPGLTAVGCHVRLFPRSRLREGWRAYERWVNSIDSPERVRAEAFVECPIVHPTLLITAARLRAVGYRDCEWAEDYDLILRLLAAGDAIGVVPRRLLGWRDGATRLTRRAERYSIHRLTACKAAFLADGFLGGVDAYILWGYGETARDLRRALLAHGKRPAYIVEVHPGRLGQVIHGARVIPLQELPQHQPLRLVASVAGAAPRQQIRAALREMGFVEGSDFVCAA